MKRSVRRLAAVMAVLVLAGCSPTEPGDELSAAVRAQTLRLKNNSDRTAYYFLVERLTAGLILWGPCNDPTTCVGIAAGESISVPYSSIYGYHAGAAEAIVYWWHIVPSADGTFKATDVRSVVLKL